MLPFRGNSSSSRSTIPSRPEEHWTALKHALENEFKICGICTTMYGSIIQPDDCKICTDERNLGQRRLERPWFTHSEMRKMNLKIEIHEVEKNLLTITLEPRGQRCFFILNPQGNVLWGCTTFIDEVTEECIRRLGGIRAIAVSHPHELYSYAKWAIMYKSPVYIHERDKDLIVYNSEFLQIWSGEEFSVSSRIKLLRLGGHYDGGAVLHWTNTGLMEDGKGVLLCADMLQIGSDQMTVSIMRSFKNYIPLSEADAKLTIRKLSVLHYDRMYTSGNNRKIPAKAKTVTTESLTKYAEAVRIPREPPPEAWTPSGSSQNQVFRRFL